MSHSIKLSVDGRTGDVKVFSPVLGPHQPWKDAQAFIGRLLAADCVESVLVDRQVQSATIRLTTTDSPADDESQSLNQRTSNTAELLRQLASSLRHSSSNCVTLSNDYAPIQTLFLRKTDEGLSGGTIVHSLPGRIRIRHPLIKNTDVSRVQKCLATVPGVKSVSISAVTGSVLILFDRAAATGSQLLGKLEGALARDSERINSFMGPPAGRWIASGVCLGLAAASTAWLPGLAPVTAAALVGFNLPTMIQGVAELATFKWRVASLYTVIMGTTLISGQFLAAALMQASITCWHGWSSWRLRRIVTRLEQQSQVPVLISRSHQRLLTQNGNFPQCLIGTDLIVSPDTVVPYDGIIISGEGELDEYSVRGMTYILRRGVGDSVYAGSILRNGSLRVRVTAVEKGTRVARVRETLLSSIAGLPGEGTPTKRIHVHASRFVPFTFATGTAALMVGDITTLAAVLRPDFATGPSISERFGTLSSIGHLWDRGWLVLNPDILHELAATQSVVIFCPNSGVSENARTASPQIRRRQISIGDRQRSVYELAGNADECVDFVHELKADGPVAVIAEGRVLSRFADNQVIRISVNPEESLVDQTADLVSLRGDRTSIEDLWQVLHDARRPHHHGWAAVMACNALAISGAFLVGLTSLHVVLITNLGALAAGVLYERHLKRSSQILSMDSPISIAAKPGSQVVFLDSSRFKPDARGLKPTSLNRSRSIRVSKTGGSAKSKMKQQKEVHARNRRRNQKADFLQDPTKTTNAGQP